MKNLKRLLKAAVFAFYVLAAVAAMRLVSVFPEPWGIIAQIVVLIIAMYIPLDDESKKKGGVKNESETYIYLRKD